MTSEQRELAWAAGLFEADGCIHTRKHNSTSVVTLNSPDEDIVVRFLAAVGGIGKIYGPYRVGVPNQNPFWTFRVTGEYSQWVIQQLYPLLGARRRAKALEVFGPREFEPGRELRLPCLAPPHHRLDVSDPIPDPVTA